jgi:glycosyltransferase involved in cell wall biosynthesis
MPPSAGTERSSVSGEPLVSIVTPVLDRVDSIGMSLASVAAQTYPNIEHIVVDGGSTDGTLDAIRLFADGHPLRWVSESDGGMYEAINKGFSLARGEVMAYLNSDDIYLPWCVDIVVETLRAGSDFAYGDLGVIRGPNDHRTFMPEFYAPFDLNHYAYFRNLGQPTVFWRRAAYEDLGGFDESYRLLGDCEFWLRAGANGCSFAHVSEVVAVQFDHAETLRRKHRDQLREEFGRLRDTHRGAAGKPARFGSVRTALGWRARFVRFYIASRWGGARSWSQFISWFDANSLPRHSKVLLRLLPARVWPRGLTFTDADELCRRLQGELSSLGNPR